MLTGNRVFDNTGGGIVAGSEVLVSRNVASDNGSQLITGGVSLSDNLCTGTLC